MTNPALNLAPKKDRAGLLERERKLRRSGQWGAWEKLTFPPGSVGAGAWTWAITTAPQIIAILAAMGIGPDRSRDQ